MDALLPEAVAPCAKPLFCGFCACVTGHGVKCNTCGEYLFEKERQSLDKSSRIPYNIYRAVNSEDNYPLDLTFRRTE